MESEVGDAPLEEAGGAYDSQTAGSNDASGYYYGEAAAYEGDNAYYYDYSDPTASQGVYYADNYDGGYYGDYETGPPAAGEYSPESPTSAVLEGADWYQDADTLDSGGAAIGDVDELQITHSLEVYGEDAQAIEPIDQALIKSEGQKQGGIVRDDPMKPAQSGSVFGSPSKKNNKTREGRIKKRQEVLEEQEENNATAKGTQKSLATAKTSSLVRKPSFVAREKAKLHLKMRIARAITRKRMPFQIRILTEPRKHASPLENYFGGPIEPALSDIYWSAIKGDIDRIKFLVEIEGVSPSDGALDPWGLGQTPLHWAAKGGHTSVINYLLQAGANPRGLDENGSLSLHLSCWAGHVEATIALLRASNMRDLYLPDYDGGLAPLDWATIRGHRQVIRAIEKYEDTLWLPKFVEDLVRGIIRYKIKLFKEPPKVKSKVAAQATAEVAPTSAVQSPGNANGGAVSKPAADVVQGEGEANAQTSL